MSCRLLFLLPLLTTYAIDGNGIVRLDFRGPITERDLNDRIVPFLKGTK